MTFRLIKPEHEDQSVDRGSPTVFLAGTIDNGAGTLWADQVAENFKDYDVTFFNPRRDVWFPDIEARSRNDFFRTQVQWELSNLSLCDIPFFYFEAGSVSPITLQELGLIIGLNRGGRHSPVVCCPDRYWRKGNVEVMCEMRGLIVHNTLDDAIENLHLRLREYANEQ